MRNDKSASTIGALLGLLAFALIAFRPAISFGTLAGQLLAGGIFEPSSASIPERMLVGFGALLVVVAVASLFLVVGAVAGTALHALALKLGIAAPGPRTRPPGSGPPDSPSLE